ncbi:MAG: hypothetical protein JOZ97_01210 [Candidatus Eremiobacteraeota bacterium]|nr:hypothetical protein [Candidatus Eremiobacteraeota bacterium]
MLGVKCTDIFERVNFSVQAARWAPWVAPHIARWFPTDGDGVRAFAAQLLADWQQR